MFRIATDLGDTRWLVYLLEEFSRINQAEFPMRVTPQQAGNSSACAIKYVTKPSEGICIPNRSHVRPNGIIETLSNRIFVLEGTTVHDRNYALPYDLFWNAFVFLARLEEYQNEIRGKKIQSYRFNHPRQDKSTFDIPVVNHLFNELEQVIRKSFPGLPFGQKRHSVIEYSHDVDYIQKTLELRVKQTVFNAFNTLKSVTNPCFFTNQVKKTAGFFFSNPSYWCFDYWEKLEKRANARSVFYVYAETGKKTLKSWLLDPSYDIARNAPLRRELKRLIHQGFEVGLHGSFCSATDEEALSKEKTVLERAMGTEIHKVRQHWLRYHERVTPYIHSKLFRWDSTLGWNDRIGFRSGVASRYRPYDHKNQKPFGYMITPQVIMDANIFDYGAQNIEFLSQKSIELLEGVRQLKSSHVSVSWHQRVCSRDYGWHNLYERVLNL